VIDAAGFDDLSDAEKVRFVENDTAATLAHLDKMLRDLDDLGASVTDPDGLIGFELGFDGRLLDLRIADAVGTVLTNIELENRLNRLFAAGIEGVADMRAGLWREDDDAGDR
jgi:hypothetical protein